MSEHIFIVDGGYFWKKLPDIALPMQVDLFGQPLGGSKRTISQHHGIFLGKRIIGTNYEVLLKLEGRSIICDDVLGTQEVHNLNSTLLLQVPQSIYEFQFEAGQKYIITPIKVTKL